MSRYAFRKETSLDHPAVLRDDKVFCVLERDAIHHFAADMSHVIGELNALNVRAEAAEARVAKLRQALVEIGQRSGRTVAEIAAKALKETEVAHV